jgi:hypothetical protein
VASINAVLGLAPSSAATEGPFKGALPAAYLRGGGLAAPMAKRAAASRSVPSAKAPRSHIVRQEREDEFLREVAEYFEKGYRPIQDMKAFAAFDRKKGEWRTLYVMPLVHFEELKAFQTIPSAEEKEEERMFG